MNIPSRFLIAYAFSLALIIVAQSLEGWSAIASKDGPEEAFSGVVVPFLNEHCVFCHNSQQRTAGVELDGLSRSDEAQENPGNILTYSNLSNCNTFSNMHKYTVFNMECGFYQGCAPAALAGAARSRWCLARVPGT